MIEIVRKKLPQLTEKIKADLTVNDWLHVNQNGVDFKTKLGNLLINLVNNLTTSTSGSALDAKQGPEIKRLIDFNAEASRLLFNYSTQWSISNEAGQLTISIPSGTIQLVNKPAYASSTASGVLNDGGAIKLTYNYVNNSYNYTFVNDITSFIEGATNYEYLIAKNIGGALETSNASLNEYIKIQGAAPTTHNNLSGLELAGTGVTWGHISNVDQNIYGNKTFYHLLEKFSNSTTSKDIDLIKLRTRYQSGATTSMDGYFDVGFYGALYNKSGALRFYSNEGIADECRLALVTKNGGSLVEGLLQSKTGVIGLNVAPPTNTDASKPILSYNSSTKDIEQIQLINQQTTTSVSSITPTGNYRENEYYVTALATNLTINAPSGTAINGNTLLIRIKDNGTARTLTFNSIYRGIGITLTATTVISKTMYIGCIYNSSDSKWDVVSLVQEV